LQIAGRIGLDSHLGLHFAGFPIRNIKHSGQFIGPETPDSLHGR
jgi:hypothetical protein